jgi:hypothetical protein
MSSAAAAPSPAMRRRACLKDIGIAQSVAFDSTRLLPSARHMQFDTANPLNDLLLIYDDNRFVKFHCGQQVLCIDPVVLVDLVRPVLIVVKKVLCRWS